MNLLDAAKKAVEYLEGHREGVVETHSVGDQIDESSMDPAGKQWVDDIDAVLVPLREQIALADGGA